MNTDIQEKVFHALTALNAAMHNIRLYPPKSPLIAQVLKNTIHAFNIAFNRLAFFSIVESEGQLLIGKKPMDPAYQMHPQITIFRQTMVNFNIKRIIFKKGITLKELNTCIDLLSKPFDYYETTGGIDEEWTKNLVHIQIEKKACVPDTASSSRVPVPKKSGDKKKNALTKNTIKIAVTKILNNEFEYFRDPIISDAVAHQICNFYNQGKIKIARDILLKLESHLPEANPEIRTHILKTLAIVSETLIDKKMYEEYSTISLSFLTWIVSENFASLLTEELFYHIIRLVKKLILKFRFEESLPIFEFLHNIQIIEDANRDEIHAMVKKGLASIASDEILNILLEEFQTNEHLKMEDAITILTYLSEKALLPLLDVLSESDDRYERERILLAIPKMCDNTHTEISDRLDPEKPWYYNRNLIYLLGKIGNEQDQIQMQPFLMHNDFRVQKEVLNSIYRIGGNGCLKILLESLDFVEDKLKLNVISILGSLKDESAVVPLSQLLTSYLNDNSKQAIAIKEKLCIALGQIGQKSTYQYLKQIVRSVNEEKNVIEAAKNALLMISRKNPELNLVNPKIAKSKAPSASKEVNRYTGGQAASEKSNPWTDKPAKDGTLFIEIKKVVMAEQDDEAAVKQHIERNEKEKGVKMCAKLAIQYAKQKNFEKAEEYAEKLMELDSMALSEIVRVNQIIEDEKSDSFDRNNIILWSGLYDELNTVEANAIYYALREKIYQAGQYIIKQGELHSNLYFINEGQVHCVYHKGNKDILIKTLRPGNILGEEIFFSNSVSTVSFLCVSSVIAHALNKDNLKKWKTEIPGVQQKLNIFCQKQTKMVDLITKKGMDRRIHTRYTIPGSTTAQLVNSSGNPIGRSFNGDLMDISKGGVCFNINVPNENQAMAILGSSIRLRITPRLEGFKNRVETKGYSISIRHVIANNYSVHIKFDKSLPSILIEQIALLKDSHIDDSDIPSI